MPFVLAMSLIACWCTDATAGPRERILRDRLSDVAPSFDAGVTLHAGDLAVTYRDATFAITPPEFFLLQLILSAPKEMISYAELYAKFWETQPPRTAKNVIWSHLKRLRRKFARIDPDFDKLRVSVGRGLYWSRTNHEKVVVGRVGVAKHVPEGYVDDVVVPLSPNEHDILLKLLTDDWVSPATVGVPTMNSFSVIVCILNRKFKMLLGHRLSDEREHGGCAIRLSRSVIGTKP